MWIKKISHRDALPARSVPYSLVNRPRDRTPKTRLVDVLLPRDTDAFTYRLGDPGDPLPPRGTRVKVPFRSSEIWGVAVGYPKSSRIPSDRIRPLAEVDTAGPILTEHLLELQFWTARYYLKKPGLVLKTMLPPGLLDGKSSGRPRTAPPGEPSGQPPPALTKAQTSALAKITAGTKPLLLFGVTGSGKTEVYLNAIDRMDDNGGALVLVPEISLTSKAYERFRGRFGEQVVLLHSGLSPGERLRAWRRLRNGEARIALGTRSAVFAPVENLSLVIVDEEHAQTYKQEEGLRYNARDLAVVRGAVEKAQVVLGSATPSLETYHHARTGKYELARLPRRVRGRSLPRVHIIDRRNDPAPPDTVSNELTAAIRCELQQNRQVMVLVNRRGYAPSLICGDCGHRWVCPQCSISLTLHKRRNVLRCHYCDSSFAIPNVCPHCRGSRVVPLGVGTEKCEEMLAREFATGRIGRMDADTTRRKHAHHRIIRDMEEGALELLVGTQMVAKGHDLPGVTVGGILNADDALNLPDFRAAEHAVQLLSQFAGRTGRGEHPGSVYIETREPDHPVYRFVANHDYEGFAQGEIALRAELGFPPFGRLIRVVFSSRRRGELDTLLGKLPAGLGSIRKKPVAVLGPAPCPRERVRGRIRYHVLIRGSVVSELREAVAVLLRKIDSSPAVRIDVDVDPIQML